MSTRLSPVAQVEPQPAPASAFRQTESSSSTGTDQEERAPLTLQSLGGGDSSATRTAEDQIDIPAFLRRQAN